MKLTMFTPTLKASAIGRMANLVAHSLVSNGHDVAIIRSESDTFFDQVSHDFPGPIIDWNDRNKVEDILTNHSDAIIYQIGDHYPYHKGCIEWLPKFSGVVCLHDYFLGNLFFGWLEKNLPEAGIILTNWYGAEIAQAFFKFDNIEAFIENTRKKSPMTEWICSMAAGVITHSSWDIQRVLSSCAGPVAVVPLAYDTHQKIGAARMRLPGDDHLDILTVGHVNLNKRAESVITAIGTSEMLKGRARYRLAGAVRPEVREKLVKLAENLKVDLTISGQVSELELASALQEADVVSCLRFPALESASASAIEAMLYGKPTMVTATGFYNEIPDEYVLKVDPSNEIASIRTVLEQLYQNQDVGSQLGKRAQRWALKTFSSRNYAEKLVEIAGRANAGQPLISMTRYFAKVIQEWGGSEELLCLNETTSPLSVFELEAVALKCSTESAPCTTDLL